MLFALDIDSEKPFDDTMSRQMSGGAALRRGRCSLSNHVYVLTVVTNDRVPLFRDFRLARTVVCTIAGLDATGSAQSLAFVVMPDHLHWLVRLHDMPMSALMRRLKGSSARHINRERLSAGRVWQPGFHDHALRSEKGVRRMARYIIENPLRAGLVDSIGDYPHWDCVWEVECGAGCG